LSLSERQQLVERESGEIPLSWQAELLSLSRSSLYYQPKPPSEREVAIKQRICAIDITYVRLRAGWMYLVAIIDWYSRYIVSWALHDTLEIGFVLETVDQALELAQPQVCNSDQGSHFTSVLYTQRLEAAGVRVSMHGRGRALDNIAIERF
jgi:putative transposase